MEKTLGGDRLGSGNKMKVHLHNYERSTHDLSYLWRSTMSAGTLVPFMSEVALPADTFDINLACEILTHPTIGPLFGSYKVQLDVFQAPIRLYNSLLHNNMLGIGLEMSKVKLPIFQPTIFPTDLEAVMNPDFTFRLDNIQVNPSCILSYLGLRGFGINNDTIFVGRSFNAIPLLAYWEIYKNYYANKQEEIGAVIHTPNVAIINTVTTVQLTYNTSTTTTVPLSPLLGQIILNNNADIVTLNYTGATPNTSQIIFLTTEHGELSADELFRYFTTTATTVKGTFNFTKYGTTTIRNWRYRTSADTGNVKPVVATFPLENIDKMRQAILSFNNQANPFNIIVDSGNLIPYAWLAGLQTEIPAILNSQEGLALKTYQSDLFNNWLQTSWIDGTTGINAITAIDTSSGSFNIDTLNLAKKVYDMLNRIAVSGGTYDDWLDAVYAHERYQRCESPMYMGGLSRELVFQEVVSNSASIDQPLGTLAGKGVMSGKKKGGHIIIKVDEPSYIIGIISLTPRLDYSQGNKWDVHLKTLDDLHKPALDQIGFQELITEQMAWWDTQWNTLTDSWTIKSAGKQPAWLNYMTNVNQTRGNFAIADNEMFMTLNRRYEADSNGIQDLSTYIDPSKFNNIFAETSLDAQNFWAQIAIDITARRKMSAKVMPNL